MQKILMSACLLGEKVRYDARDKKLVHALVETWQREGRVVALCPETSGGLSVPRPPAEIVDDKVVTLLGDDVTEAFKRGAQAALQLCQEHNIKMAILKARSPSCGNDGIYDGTFTGTVAAGQGITAQLLSRHGITVFNEDQIPKAAKFLSELEAVTGEDDDGSKVPFSWFPGHMKKATEEIQSKLAMVDVVVEVRDARAPLVTGNPLLKAAIKNKAHLILFNKTNLAHPAKVAQWEAWFKRQGADFLFLNCLDKASLKLLLPKARRMIEERRAASNPQGVKEKTKIRMMIVGLPNTGKSTLINELARRKATKSEDRPGLTRQQLWVKVDETLELLDTPGIMRPNIEKDEHRFWLSAINAIPDGIVPAEGAASFLIQHFLREKSSELLARYKLESLEESVEATILKIAAARGCIKQKGVPDLERVYKIIIQDFRSGALGKTCFGVVPT